MEAYTVARTDVSLAPVSRMNGRDTPSTSTVTGMRVGTMVNRAPLNLAAATAFQREADGGARDLDAGWAGVHRRHAQAEGLRRIGVIELHRELAHDVAAQQAGERQRVHRPRRADLDHRDPVDGEIPEGQARRQLRPHRDRRARELGRVDEHDGRAGVDAEPPTGDAIQLDVGEDQVGTELGRRRDALHPIVGNPDGSSSHATSASAAITTSATSGAGLIDGPISTSFDPIPAGRNDRMFLW
jgi:hypothetical protein